MHYRTVSYFGFIPLIFSVIPGIQVAVLSGQLQQQTSLLEFSDTQFAVTEPLPTYTIEICHVADLDDAQRYLDDISHVIPIPVRIEKSDHDYVIYAGISEKSSDLISYLETVKRNGYPRAFMRTGKYLKERIISEITQKERGQSNILELSQKEQHGTGKVKLSDIEKEIITGIEESSEEKLARRGGYYIGKAWQYFNTGDYKQAIDFFSYALEFPETELEAKFGIARCYTSKNEPENALPLFEEFVKKGFQLEVTLPDLIALLIAKADYTQASIYVDNLELSEKEKWQEKIEQGLIRQKFQFAIESGDINLLANLVQVYQNELKAGIIPEVFYHVAEILVKHGRKEDAIEIYHDLLSACPEEWDLRLGIFYNLKSLLALSETEILAKKESNRLSLPSVYKEKLVELRLDILRDRLASAPSASPKVKELASEILAIRPDDPDALITLAWWYYNSRQYDAAYKTFSELYQQDTENKDYALGLIYIFIKLNKYDDALDMIKRFDLKKDPQIADSMFALYDKTGKEKAAFSLAESLARTNDKTAQRTAGDFFFNQGMTITAAQVYSGTDTAYYHADIPSLQFFPYYRSKSGEDGISRLKEYAFPFSVHLPFTMPFAWGSELRISFNTKELSAGNAAGEPFVGKFFKGDQQHGLLTSLTVTVPVIELKKEGNTSYAFELGSTPLNGVIEPLPTFSAQMRQRYWRLNIHQRSIDESILSYVGLEDPYSDAEWGRVVRSGGEAEFTFSPFPSYWLSLKGGYDYYWGKNVVGNHTFHSAIAFGRTFSLDTWDFTPSLFLSGNHFQRDTSFYTFGHGGYFSPEIFYNTGPALKFQTKPGQTFWVEGQISAGAMHYQLNGAPHYPFESGQKGQYEGATFTGLSYSLQLEGQKLLTPHFSAGGGIKLNNSADYTEWAVGLAFYYFFEPRSRLTFR